MQRGDVTHLLGQWLTLVSANMGGPGKDLLTVDPIHHLGPLGNTIKDQSRSYQINLSPKPYRIMRIRNPTHPNEEDPAGTAPQVYGNQH